jgi:hypothetical protein
MTFAYNVRMEGVVGYKFLFFFFSEKRNMVEKKLDTCNVFNGEQYQQHHWPNTQVFSFIWTFKFIFFKRQFFYKKYIENCLKKKDIFWNFLKIMLWRK